MATDWSYDGWDYLSREETRDLHRAAKSQDFKHYRGNAFVNIQDGCYTLMSYETVVVSVVPRKSKLYVKANAFEYSRTTNKHISLFLRDYVDGMALFDLRNAVNNDASEVVNAYTGEVFELVIF